MPQTELAKLSKAQLIALLTASPAAPSEASQHWTAKDLACTVKGCKFTGRTKNGLAFHVARTDPNAHTAK